MALNHKTRIIKLFAIGGIYICEPLLMLWALINNLEIYKASKICLFSSLALHSLYHYRTISCIQYYICCWCYWNPSENPKIHSAVVECGQTWNSITFQQRISAQYFYISLTLPSPHHSGKSILHHRNNLLLSVLVLCVGNMKAICSKNQNQNWRFFSFIAFIILQIDENHKKIFWKLFFFLSKFN